MAIGGGVPRSQQRHRVHLGIAKGDAQASRQAALEVQEKQDRRLGSDRWDNDKYIKSRWGRPVTTAHHARYFAHKLTRLRPATGANRLSRSLFDAYVDLNPHQFDAASFTLHSPIAKGVVLANGVGLGKTIDLLIEHGISIQKRTVELLEVEPGKFQTSKLEG